MLIPSSITADAVDVIEEVAEAARRRRSSSASPPPPALTGRYPCLTKRETPPNLFNVSRETRHLPPRPPVLCRAFQNASMMPGTRTPAQVDESLPHFYSVGSNFSLRRRSPASGKPAYERQQRVWAEKASLQR